MITHATIGVDFILERSNNLCDYTSPTWLHIIKRGLIDSRAEIYTGHFNYIIVNGDQLKIILEHYANLITVN